MRLIKPVSINNGIEVNFQRMKTHIIFLLVFLLVAGAKAQVKISETSGNPNPSSMLDVESTDRGFLPPRMTTLDRMSISNPAAGLMIFNTDLNCMEYFNGSGWFSMCGIESCLAAPSAPSAQSGSVLIDEIVWSWSSSEVVSGYRWNVSNDYSSAQDIGTATTYAQNELACGTEYTAFVWAYNYCGHSEPLPLSASTLICFSCGDSATDIDGNSYPTVQLGERCWFTSNLKTTHYANGENIPNEVNASSWTALNSGAWAYYNNNSANNGTYGKLYNFFAVVDPRGLCPSGFHAATDADWTSLTTLLGGESVAGGKLKSTGTSLWFSPNSGATNEVGFNAYPGGVYYLDGTNPAFFANQGFGGYFWSSTIGGQPNTGWRRRLAYEVTEVNRENYDQRNGMSVRCVLD